MQRWKPILVAAGARLARAAFGERSPPLGHELFVRVLGICANRIAPACRLSHCIGLRISTLLTPAAIEHNGPFVASPPCVLHGAIGLKGEFTWGELHCTRCLFRASAAHVD